MPRSSLPAIALLVLAALSACTSEKGVDVFPLYRNIAENGHSETSVLWPLSNFEQTGDEKTSWTFPFFYASSDANQSAFNAPLFPPLYSEKETPMESTTQFFPLFSHAVNGARTKDSLLLFLADWERTRADGLVSLSLLPLFQWGDEPGRSRFALGHVGGAGPAALVSLYEQETAGLSYRGNGEEDQDGFRLDIGRVLGYLVNLFHYDNIGSHSETRLLTVLGIESASLFQRVSPHAGAPGADRERTVVFPLWWDLREGNEQTTLFWPPYGRTTRDGTTIAHYVLFPLLRIEDEPDREFHRTDFIWPLTGRLTEKGNSYTWFFPLFRHWHYTDGYQWDVILSMFGYKRRAEARELTLFWYGIDF